MQLIEIDVVGLLCILMPFTNAVQVTFDLDSSAYFSTGDLILTCRVDQDVNINSATFRRDQITQIGIYDPTTTCTPTKFFPTDLHNYSTSCVGLRNLTLTKYGVNKTEEQGRVWQCTFISNPGGPCISTSPCVSPNITVPLETTTTSTTTPTPSPLPIILTPHLVCVAVIVILLILFCCGCLDCCKFCRIFDHYEVSKSCYVTWYFIKRGCCSFFFCKSGSKRGKCFCGDHKGERCGGCLSCRNKCTCGWPGNCKTMDSSCGGYWFCLCCGTPRRDEEDPLIVCIDNKDALCRPADDKMTITCSVNGYGPDDIISAWTGPQGNELTNSTKHKITPYNKDTGKSSLTISPFCSSDNGQYTCQVTDGDGFFVEDSIVITVHGTERNTNITGAPGIHIGTEKKVKPETTSKKTKDRPQPSPSVAIVTEDIPKYRPQPKPPENLQGISTNFDDSRGLPTDIPRSSRLPPLTHNQSTVEEEDASEKPKKTKSKKKKKSKVNEGKSEEETDESKSKRTLLEDQSVED